MSKVYEIRDRLKDLVSAVHRLGCGKEKVLEVCEELKQDELILLLTSDLELFKQF